MTNRHMFMFIWSVASHGESNRMMKGELEDLGEEYDNVESISKIQTQILNQTKGAVNIFDDAGNFRATYDILKDIAEVWDKISQVDQAALLETIAGKQRGNQIAALIQSFQSGQAQKAYVDAINSSGSAMQEQERRMQSLEAKTQQFEAAFQSLSNTVLDSDLLKFFVDLGTTGVKAIQGIISALTPLGALGFGAGLFAVIKNIDMFKTQLQNISSVLNAGDTTQLLVSFTALDASQQKVLLSSKLLTEQQKEQCLVMATLSSANSAYTAEEIAKATGISSETLATWGLTEATDKLTISQLSELASSDAQAKTALEKIVAQNAQAVANGEVTASNVALATSEGTATLATGTFTTAIKANIAAMWTWMTTTPIGMLTMLASGIFVAVKAYDGLTTSLKEQKEKMEDANETYKESKQNLESITSELNTQTEELNRLKAIKNPTYADEEEIKKLEQITEQLLIQEDLAKRAEERAKRDLANETVKTINKQYGDISDVSTDNVNKNVRTNLDSQNLDNIFFDDKDISKSLAGYSELANKVSELTAEYNSLSKEEKEAYGESIQSDIEYYQKSMDELSNSGFEAAQTLIEEQQNLQDYYDILKDSPYDELEPEQKKVIDSYNNISNAINTIYSVLDPTKLDDFTKAEMKAGDAARYAIESTNESSESTDAVTSQTAKSVKSNIKEIEQALGKLDKGKFTNSDLMDILEKFPGIDTSKVDFSNFNGLAEQLKIIENIQLDSVINAMDKAGKFKTPEDLENFRQILLDTSESADDFKDAMIELNDSMPSLDNLNSAFLELDKNGEISSDTIVKLYDDFGNLSSFQNFADVAQNSTKRTDELAKATNELVNEFIKSCGIIDDLTLANADFIANALEEKGVTNALEVALSALNITYEDYTKIKEICSQRGIELTNVTVDEAKELINEANCSDTAKQALATYVVQKEIANCIALKTSGDIKNLQDLCAQCGITINALGKLAKAKEAWEKIKSGDRSVYGMNAGFSSAAEEASWWANYIQDLETQVKTEASNLSGNNTNGGYTPPSYTPPKDTGKKKGSKKTKTKKDESVEVDYLSNSIENLTRNVEEYQKVRDGLDKNSTNFYKDEKDAIEAENVALKELIGNKKKVDKKTGKVTKASGYLGAQQYYNNEYEKYLNKTGNADKYRKLIENGTIDVAKYKNTKLGDSINSAIEARNKALEYEEKIKEAKDKQLENNRQIIKSESERLGLLVEQKGYELDSAKSAKERKSIRNSEISLLKNQMAQELKLATSDEEILRIKYDYEQKIRDLRKDNYADSEKSLQIEYDKLESSKDERESLIDIADIIKEQKKLRKSIYYEALKQVATDEEKAELQAKYNEDIKKLNEELYKNKISLEEKSINLQKDANDILKQQIEFRNAQNGTDFSKDDYEKLITSEKELQNLYSKRVEKIEKEMIGYELYSEKWNESYDNLIKYKGLVASCTKQIIEYNKSIENIPIDNLKKQNDVIKNTYDELRTLYDTTVNQDNLVDKNGNLTADANSAILLDNKMITANKARIATVQKMIDELTKSYNDGKISVDEYTNGIAGYRNEIANLSKDNISLQNDITSIKIKSLEAINNAIKEQVELQKDAIAQEEKLRQEQKKSIKDAESLAKKKALADKLKYSDSSKDKQRYNSLIDEIKKMQDEQEDDRLSKLAESKKEELDKSVENVEKSTNEQIDIIKRSSDKQEQIVKEMLANVNNNYSSTLSHITTTASKYSIDMTQFLSDGWLNATSSIDTYIAKAQEAMSLSGNGSTNGQSDEISYILSHGNGTGKGTSDLNKAVVANGGTQLSYAQMAQLAKLLGLGYYNADYVKNNSSIKDNILAMLKNMGYLNGNNLNFKIPTNLTKVPNIGTTAGAFAILNTNKNLYKYIPNTSTFNSIIEPKNVKTPVFSPNINVDARNMGLSGDDVANAINKQVIPVVNDYMRKKFK